MAPAGFQTCLSILSMRFERHNKGDFRLQGLQLSILSMRFQQNIDLQIDRVSLLIFQFSLWDSSITSRSFALRTRFSLSILSMRFRYTSGLLRLQQDTSTAFNSLYEILTFLNTAMLIIFTLSILSMRFKYSDILLLAIKHHLDTFNSLYEILLSRIRSKSFKYSTFNSLYEIPTLSETKTQVEFLNNSLSILSMRFLSR